MKKTLALALIALVLTACAAPAAPAQPEMLKPTCEAEEMGWRLQLGSCYAERTRTPAVIVATPAPLSTATPAAISTPTRITADAGCVITWTYIWERVVKDGQRVDTGMMVEAIQAIGPDEGTLDSDVGYAWLCLDEGWYPPQEPTPAPNQPESDKGDGFYLVGVDIAPGVWRSSGTGDSCYWATTTQTGDIINNHFGMSGGTAYVSPGAFQVEFKGCGLWAFISPP